jgi:hypothetical protein
MALYGVDWIDLAQHWDKLRAVVSAVMNLRVQQNAGNFLTTWRALTFSKRTVVLGVSDLISWLFSWLVGGLVF